jgi:hypothetical protein
VIHASRIPGALAGAVSRRARGPLACLLACLVAGAATWVAAPPAAAAETGIVPAPNQTVSGPERAADLGVGWARLFVNWGFAEPSDDVFNTVYVNGVAAEAAAYRARGIKVLVVLTGSPQWASGSASGIGPPIDAAKYAEFAAHMVAQMPSVSAWEVWNEADDNLFWESGPDAPRYAALLRATYPAIKAANPAAIVVSTGMVGNNFGFLAQLYANAAGGSFDAVAVHTDTACLIAPPEHFYRELDGRVGRFSFTGYREVHQVMAANGDGLKPIWMTELGWNTSSTAPNSCRDGSQAGTKPAGVTEAQQARNLTKAYECMAADPFVTVSMWFSLQDIRGRPNYDGHLGLLRADASAKPAYAAMKALANGTRVAPDPTCGGRLDHVPPSVAVARPVDGLRFVNRIALRATAADAPGGSGVKHIQVLVNGAHVRNFKGSAVNLDPWYHSSNRLSLGTHTLTLRAHDNAGNTAEQSVRVEKVRRGVLPALRTSLGLDVRRLRGRRVTLRGNLTRAASDLPVGGRVYIAIQRRFGKRHRRVRTLWTKASAPFVRTIRLPARGRYRALAYYRGDDPYRPARSRYRAFTIR